jgi:hypothetical protein
MMKYFDRVCAIDISPDIRVENHKIKFEVKKNIIANKNTCRVDIYNLAENTRNKITNDINSLVRIKAGYSQNVGLVEIGQGNISNVIHSFRRPDILSIIYSKDGFKAVRDNSISLSFKENTPLSSVINSLVDKLDLPVKFTDYDKSAILKGGFSHLGSIPSALDELSLQFKFNWSIQNGQIQILDENKGTGKRVMSLSSSTGLIEDPEEVIVTKKLKKKDKNEYKVVSLLQPQLEAGDLIEIDSRTLTGVFIVNELEHIGDTRGNEWYTIMIVVKNG